VKAKIATAVALAMAMHTSAAIADCLNTGDGRVVCEGPVRKLTHREQGIAFQLEGNVAASLPCVMPVVYTGDNGWWTIDRTDPLYRERYALLLTAAAANGTLEVVSFAVTSPSDTCAVRRIEWQR
jgi:hypothetical protein